MNRPLCLPDTVTDLTGAIPVTSAVRNSPTGTAAPADDMLLALPDAAVSSIPPRRQRRETPAQTHGSRPTEQVIDLTDSPPPAATGPPPLIPLQSTAGRTSAAQRTVNTAQVIDLDAEPDVRTQPAPVPNFPLPNHTRPASHTPGRSNRESTSGVDRSRTSDAAQMMRAIQTNRALAERHAMHRAHQHGRARGEPYSTGGPARRQAQGRYPGDLRRAPQQMGRFGQDQMDQVFAFFGYPQATTRSHGTGPVEPRVTGYLTTPYGGGPVPLPQDGQTGAAAMRALSMLQGTRFVAPSLDYGLYAHVRERARGLANGFAGRFFAGQEPEPEPPVEKYDAPEPCKEPFTRTFTSDDYLVCPSCEVELGSGEDEQKRKIWITKCGHVFCGRCAASILSAKYAKGKGRRCAAPDCGKGLSKSKMFEAYV